MRDNRQFTTLLWANGFDLKKYMQEGINEEPIEVYGKAYLDEFHAQIRKEMYYNLEGMEEKERYLSREETEEYFNGIVGKVFVNDLNGKRTYAVPYSIREDVMDDNETIIYRIVTKIIWFPKFYDVWHTVEDFQSFLRTGYNDNGTMREVLGVLQDVFLDTITALDDICDDETFADELNELYQREKHKIEDNEEELQMLRARKTGDALPFPVNKLRIMSPYKMRLAAKER